MLLTYFKGLKAVSDIATSFEVINPAISAPAIVAAQYYDVTSVCLVSGDGEGCATLAEDSRGSTKLELRIRIERTTNMRYG